MNLLPVLILFAALLPTVSRAQSVEELQKAAAATSDRSTQARLYKQLGDLLVAQDNLEQAAGAYSSALAANREGFSPADRVRMAIYLSWADRLAESEAELRRVLEQDPNNIAARTHLARVLSWSGELNGAIREADIVLRDSPNHKDALLVKADALQWQGRYLAAMPVYRQVLAQGEDFDARAGLSRSLLALGDRISAVESAKLLNPSNARQRREAARLTDAIERETRPVLDARYNYYTDSDRNHLDRYALAGSFWLGNQKYGVDYRHTEATDRERANRGEEFLVSIYSRLTDRFSAGAGLGFTQVAGDHTSNFPTGHFRVDAKLFAGRAGANISREVLTDTAELIENRIRMTNVGLYITQPLTDRLSTHAGYRYRSFSDGNHANELQLVTQYAIVLAPRIAIGHRFRLLDFHKQSGSGYFDPNNYIANRAFASLYYEHSLFYTYLEGYVGYQTFRRNGLASDELIHGGSGSLGVKPLRNLAVEVNAEGGNFAAGATSGFSYFIIGPRIVYRF
ncbi:MAG TPA: tetratricopeptide repeat protein [Pyrinomonadaceae bacterium]|nr:tetratricopeptide repeat protein [Pyrinomonadaceae bacterium]